MDAIAAYFRELSTRAGHAWNEFWFTPSSPILLGRLRIAVGLLTLAYFATWAGQLTVILGGEGLLPPQTVRELFEAQNRHLYRFSPLYWIEEPGQLAGYHCAAIAIATLFTAGMFTRVTSVLTLLALLTFVHRAPLVTGPLETILAMLLLYLSVGPSGAAFSFDAWWAQRKGLSLDQRSWIANMSRRLIQVHLAGLLLLVGVSMLASPAWWDGTAIWTLEAQAYGRPFDLSFLRSWPKLMNAWAHLFVLVNLIFPVLVWNRLLRPLVLAITALLWASMILVSGQILYVTAVFVAMYAFVSLAPSSEFETA